MDQFLCVPLLPRSYAVNRPSRVYRVTQLRTNGVLCRESAGTGPEVLEVVPVMCSVFSGYRRGPIFMRPSFPTLTIIYHYWYVPGSGYVFVYLTLTDPLQIQPWSCVLCTKYLGSVKWCTLLIEETSLATGFICSSRYFECAHFIPRVDVGKRGAYSLVRGDLRRQHPFGTTLRFTGPMPADYRRYAIA